MKTIRGLAAMLAVVACASALQAEIYTFTNITNNDPLNAATGEAQFTVDVTQVSGRAQFYFANSGPNPSRLSLLAFESGGVLGSFYDLINGPGVNFVHDPSPGNLPGGNSLSPPFEEVFTDSRNGNAATGVDPGEHLTVIYNLVGGASFADLIAALDDGSLRVGIHAIAFGYYPGDTVDRGSEAFITTPQIDTPPPPVVPAPGAVTLGVLGLVTVGLWQRRRMVP